MVLPGMEGVRNGKLDNICEAIGDARRELAIAKATERSEITSALSVMQARDITIYRHAGVELARVPGAEKLRVRLTKEEGDASVEGDDPTTTGRAVPPDDDPDDVDEGVDDSDEDDDQGFDALEGAGN